MLEEGEAVNSRLPSFNAYYAICHKFGQTRKCLVHVRQGELLREEFGEDVIYWVERPEDEYGIDRAIYSRQFACVLYRDDWLRGEHMRDPKHSVMQFGVGDRVRLAKCVHDKPVGTETSIVSVYDDQEEPKVGPPIYRYVVELDKVRVGVTYDKLELVAKAKTYLFSESDEIEFKRQFAIQWLAAIEAVNYQDNCYRGWKDHKPPVEDAESLANHAWEEWKETIGVEQ